MIFMSQNFAKIFLSTSTYKALILVIQLIRLDG